jgi:hypothetical protein
MGTSEMPLADQKIQNSPDYLMSGQQTVITPGVEKIAEKFEGNFEGKIRGIFDFIRTFRMDVGNKNEIFRKRTAEQIISDGYITGCTDAALVFITLARAAGIPAKYIETVDKEWLRTGGSSLAGHIYSGVLENDKWRIADPMMGRLDVDIEKDGRIVMAEGSDSWDIGIRSMEELEERFGQFRAQEANSVGHRL